MNTQSLQKLRACDLGDTEAAPNTPTCIWVVSRTTATTHGHPGHNNVDNDKEDGEREKETQSEGPAGLTTDRRESQSGVRERVQGRALALHTISSTFQFCEA